MNIEEYKSIDEAFDKAQEDTTPFVVVNNGEVNVVGDANKTEINSHDYTVRFRIPVQENGKTKYKWLTKEYKDVYITPRMDTKITRAAIAILPFMRKDEDGKFIKYTQDEMYEILDKFDDQVMDAMYDLVACVLRIDRNIKDFMDPKDVMSVGTRILLEFPEMVNEAETFFE